MLTLALQSKPTQRYIPTFRGGFYVSDDERRQLGYGLHMRATCEYTAEICRYARMLRKGEMVEGDLPFRLDREQEFYLRGKIKDVEANNRVLLTVDINGTSLRIVRR